MLKLTYILFLTVIILTMVVPFEGYSKNPEKWWLQSARADTVETFLFHTSGRYSFTRMKGVISGDTHSGDINLVVRKNVFTNYSVYKTDKMDLSLKSSINLNYQTTAHYFTDYIDIDFSKVVYGQSGFIWERDDALLILNRYSVYAGIGFNTLLFKKFNIKSLFAFGRIDQEYIIPVDDLDVIKGPYSAFYFRQNYDLIINPNLSLSGQVHYFTDINEMDRYRYGADLNLRVSLVKHFNLIVGYSYKYDRENLLFGIIPENSMQNMGVELSF